MSQGEDDVLRRRHNVKFCEGWLQHKVRHVSSTRLSYTE